MATALVGYFLRNRWLPRSNPHIVGALKSLPGTLKEFQYKDLLKATNKFDEKRKLGQGGFGVVYKGYLANENLEVAVKVFTWESLKGEDDFLDELHIINRLRHKHLVRLLGWCHKNGKSLLVYEYMPNGSLDKHLFSDAESKPLRWTLRHKIISGVAAALHYLHNENDQQVVHRDVKASNILLDSDFNARLGDFGLARALENEKTSYAGSKGIVGTFGYIAPECLHTGKATERSDVYAFGAVLLEVVCGFRSGTRIGGCQSLVDWVWALHGEGRLLEAVDNKLKENYVVEEAQRILLLGLACSHPTACERPKTQEILQILSGSVAVPQVPPFKQDFVWASLPMGEEDSALATTANTISFTTSHYESGSAPLAIDSETQRPYSDSFNTRGSSSSGASNTSKVAEEKVVVGFKEIETLLGKFHDSGVGGWLEIIIVGAVGGGKTTLAREVYEHPLTSDTFEVHEWVNVSQDYDKTMKMNLLIPILELASPKKYGDYEKSSEDKLGEDMHKCLKGKKYLIVMDDIWGIETWNDIQRSLTKECKGSKVLFTSRLLVEFNSIHCVPHYLAPLPKSCSWELLQKKVFRKKCCPPELVGIGEHLAEKCEGLPLAIVAIASILAVEDKTLSVWEEVSKKCLSSIIAKNQDGCMEILELCYNHLPLHLKACFVYIERFPEDSDIWDDENMCDINRIAGKKLEHSFSKSEEQEAFDATNNRANVVKADERGRTVSNSEKGSMREALKRDCLTNISVEGLRKHFDSRRKDAAKGLGDSNAWKSVVVLDSLPLGTKSNSIRHIVRWRTLTHKHCVRLKKSQDLPRSLEMDFSGGLAAQSAIGLPDGRHILSLSRKKIVRKTLKRKGRTMSVHSLEDRQQHVDRKWEGAAKSLSSKCYCRQLVIHRVPTGKRISRQHGINQGPFQLVTHLYYLFYQGASTQIVYVSGLLHVHFVGAQSSTMPISPLFYWATRKRYSMGDERSVEVISLAMDGKLVSRLLLIHISWLGRFSPRPSALRGGEIVQPIALLSNEFAGTINGAHLVGQDQSGSTASHSGKKRTRQIANGKWINSSISLEDLQQHFGTKRKDAAESLGVSVSTFKRICRQHGIEWWPTQRRSRDHPNHGKGINSSISLEDLQQHFGRKRKDAAESLRVSVSTFKRICRQHGIEWWPTQRGSRVLKPPDPAERNASSTCKTLSTHGHTEMENEMVEFAPDFCDGSNGWNIENGSLGTPTFHDPSASNYLDMGISVSSILEESGMGSYGRAFQQKDQSTTLSTPYPNANAILFQQPQVASTVMSSGNMGSSNDCRYVLPPQAEGRLEGHGFGATMPTCSDLASSQLMRTNPYTMLSIPHTTPPLTVQQDMRSVMIKAIYGIDGNTIIKFQLPLSSELIGLKEEVSKRLKFEHDSFDVKYKDEYGDLILIACDEDLRDCLKLFSSLSNQEIRLWVFDKFANTTNFCKNCRSLKRKRS